MSEPKNGCRVCGQKPKVYAVVRWADLVFWCSNECWIADEKAAMDKAEKNRSFLLTGVKYVDPTGK